MKNKKNKSNVLKGKKRLNALELLKENLDFEVEVKNGVLGHIGNKDGSQGILYKIVGTRHYIYLNGGWVEW